MTDARSYRELDSLLDRTSEALVSWAKFGLSDAQRADVFTQVIGILTPWAAHVESRNNLPGIDVPDDILRPMIADLGTRSTGSRPLPTEASNRAAADRPDR